MINEFNLGIGNSSVKLSYNKKDQEMAHLFKRYIGSEEMESMVSGAAGNERDTN